MQYPATESDNDSSTKKYRFIPVRFRDDYNGRPHLFVERYHAILRTHPFYCFDSKHYGRVYREQRLNIKDFSLDPSSFILWYYDSLSELLSHDNGDRKQFFTVIQQESDKLLRSKREFKRKNISTSASNNKKEFQYISVTKFDPMNSSEIDSQEIRWSRSDGTKGIEYAFRIWFCPMEPKDLYHTLYNMKNGSNLHPYMLGIVGLDKHNLFIMIGYDIKRVGEEYHDTITRSSFRDVAFTNTERIVHSRISQIYDNVQISSPPNLDQLMNIQPKYVTECESEQLEDYSDSVTFASVYNFHLVEDCYRRRPVCSDFLNELTDYPIFKSKMDSNISKYESIYRLMSDPPSKQAIDVFKTEGTESSVNCCFGVHSDAKIYGLPQHGILIEYS